MHALNPIQRPRTIKLKQNRRYAQPSSHLPHLISQLTINRYRLRIDENIENQDRIVDVNNSILVSVSRCPAAELEPHRDMVPDDLSIILVDNSIAVRISENHRPRPGAWRILRAPQLISQLVFTALRPGSRRLDPAGKKKVQGIDSIGQLNNLKRLTRPADCFLADQQAGRFLRNELSDYISNDRVMDASGDYVNTNSAAKDNEPNG